MALYILRNDTYVSTPDGVLLFRAGRIIDDSKLNFPLSRFADAGGSLTPVGDAENDVTGALLRKLASRGGSAPIDPNAPPWVTDLNDIMPPATVANSVLQRTYPPGTGAPFFAPLTQDQIAAAYVISLSHSPTAVTVGQTVVTPAFTATYNRTASAAVLTDSDGTTPLNVISSPTSFSSTGTFTKGTFGAGVTFTLTANEAGGPSKTATSSITWLQPLYFGQAVPAAFTEAFIEALPQSALASSRARTFTATAGATERLYYALRSAFGTPTFTVGAFTGGFHIAASGVSVTNAFGFTETYDVWESDNLNLGATTVVVG